MFAGSDERERGVRWIAPFRADIHQKVFTNCCSAICVGGLLNAFYVVRISVVVFKTEVRDQIFAAKIAQGVFEFHQLNEDVMLGVERGGRLG
jgi:hypothetical protein